MELRHLIQIYTPSEGYVTVKDHKENEEYRLINPAKTDIGKCSKQILQKIIEELNDKIRV